PVCKKHLEYTLHVPSRLLEISWRSPSEGNLRCLAALTGRENYLQIPVRSRFSSFLPSLSAHSPRSLFVPWNHFPESVCIVRIYPFPFVGRSPGLHLMQEQRLISFSWLYIYYFSTFCSIIPLPGFLIAPNGIGMIHRLESGVRLYIVHSSVFVIVVLFISFWFCLSVFSN